MTLQHTNLRLTLLAMAVSILATAPAPADETSGAEDASGQTAEDVALLQRNLHEMRLIVDSDRAQRKAIRRANAGGLIIDSRDAPGIGTMRAELAESLERLASRCFGNEIDAGGGNVILICGNNAGTAESSNVTSAAYTTVVIPPESVVETDDEALPEPEEQP
jgi:hypothetical protein